MVVRNLHIKGAPFEAASRDFGKTCVGPACPIRWSPIDSEVIDSHILVRISSHKARAVTLRNWSVQDAKNRFSEVVEAARRQPQMVTKHGKPTVVVVAADEYERLRKLQHLKAPSLAELLLSMPTDGEEFERLDGRMRDPGF